MPDSDVSGLTEIVCVEVFSTGLWGVCVCAVFWRDSRLLIGCEDLVQCERVPNSVK